MLMNHTNQTEDDVFSCYSPSVVGYHYFAVLWGCAVTITGSVGNLMTILAFASDPQLRTRFNVLIVNLALADLLYCTILQPTTVDSYLHLRWRSGQLWCRISGLLSFLTNSVSIITLCLIAGGRYLLVAKRAVFDRVFSDCGLSLLLVSTWALALATFCPLWSAYVLVPKICACGIHRTTYHPYPTFLLLFYFFIGLGCVGTFYFLIYRHVWTASQALLRYRLSRRSSRKKPTSSTQVAEASGVDSGMPKICGCEMSTQEALIQNQDEVISVEPSQSTDSSTVAISATKSDIVAASSSPTPAPTHAVARDDKDMRYLTRMCLTVFLCFMFCFVPFMLINLVDKKNRAPLVLHMFCANLTWLNSCINPILYAVMNRQFRQAYHVLLTRAAAAFTSLWT